MATRTVESHEVRFSSSNEATEFIGPTILVYDDNDDVREVTRRILAGVGYRVLTAADGDDALAVAAVESGPIGLLITGIAGPKVSGRDLAARFAKLRPRTRVLYMSGNPTEIVHMRALGPDADLIEKPFDAETLLERVAQILRA
jgi:DNA-binding response OmpR family regulator